MNFEEMSSQELERHIDALSQKKEQLRKEQDEAKKVLNRKLREDAVDEKLKRFKPHELELLAQRVTAKPVTMQIKTQVSKSEGQ